MPELTPEVRGILYDGLDALDREEADSQRIHDAIGRARTWLEALPDSTPPLVIWWTDQHEAETVYAIVTTRAGAPGGHPPWPEYLSTEFRSRMGRNGRGRLWVEPGLGKRDIQWDVSKPAAHLAGQRAGIVLLYEDAPCVWLLPGFLTDMELNFINGLDGREAQRAATTTH